MTTGTALRWGMLAVLLACLTSMGAVCEMTVVNPPADNTDLSPVTDDTDDATDPTGDEPSDDDDDMNASGNPNSSCADTTDVEVVYVNASSARVVFVENFRDESYAVLSSKMLTLQAAGDSGDEISKCIPCPYQAGIRNIKYVEDSIVTSVSYPDDLYQPAFTCGDRITFTFGADSTVRTSVQSP